MHRRSSSFCLKARQPLFCYAVSDSASQTIVDLAATLGASRLTLGAPRRHAMTNLLRGNLVREVSDTLPEEIDLLVYRKDLRRLPRSCKRRSIISERTW